MKTTAETRAQYNGVEPVLYMALELGEKTWKLGFTVGLGQRARMRSISGSDLKALEREIRRAKQRFGLDEKVPVVSCYEAGRDGFWVHRFLTRQEIRNWVVDSSSIEVNRRARRVKSDRLDAAKLVEMLVRFRWGEQRVWRTVHVPGASDEDDRHLHRSLKRFKQERTARGNRIRGLLKTEGIALKGSLERWREADLDELRNWEGKPLREGLRGRVARELRQLERIREEIEQMEAERRQRLREGAGKKLDQICRLELLKGIGINASWTLVMEMFGWRAFRNRRQVASCLGMVSSPWQSGDSYREQGISKEGNRWCRDVMVGVAWLWLQWQPESELSRWFHERFGGAGKRARKVGIVALARKLSIQLWRYLETGEIPPGAVFHSRL